MGEGVVLFSGQRGADEGIQECVVHILSVPARKRRSRGQIDGRAIRAKCIRNFVHTGLDSATDWRNVIV